MAAGDTRSFTGSLSQPFQELGRRWLRCQLPQFTQQVV